MAFVPLPTAEIDDVRVACVLRRAVQLINPVVDALSTTDPFGLKGRSWRLGAADGSLDKALDALAWLLNAADVPGTHAWDEKDLDGKVNWWVRRVGALDTVLVAFPGLFGAVADRLPIQDVLGFTNQAIVLCAVARECGVEDQGSQVRLLGAVMCHRDLGSVNAEHALPAEPTEFPAQEEKPLSFLKSLWHIAGQLRAIGGELGKRPQPRSIYRYLGMLPAVGAIADYFGEYGALVRASKAGRAWIAQHPAIDPA